MRFFFLIFFIISSIDESFGVINLETECLIDKTDRIRLGDDTITEIECRNDSSVSFNCFESGYGCFASKYSIPGFKYHHEIISSHRVQDVLDEKAQDPRICANYCLKDEECFSFTVFKNKFGGKYCMLNKSSKQVIIKRQDTISYVRFAFPFAACEVGDCEEAPQITYDLKDSECIDSCRNDASCSHYSYLDQKCNKYSKCTLNKNIARNYVCSITNATLPSNSNYPTEVLEQISDQSMDTCTPIKPNDLVVRYPFPGVSVKKAVAEIFVKVNGQDLICNDQTKNNLMVYVPNTDDYEVRFIGYFKTCHLINNNSTICEYICNCESRFCEAIYVRSYTNICEIEIT